MNHGKHDPIDYFPLSVATGEAFCNRVNEIKRLQTCITHRRPVLLVSPRRYGKTSLALRTIKETNLPYAHIDLFSVIDERDIEKCILKGIETLISRMESLPKKAFAMATELFEGAHIRVALTKIGIVIETEKEREKPAYRVLDMLERLEKLAQKADKQIILFFDEFQAIREITPDHAMESVLRQVAQLTQSISFIFSGSSRHLLNELFEDRERPFYKLCERITLKRILENAYTKHIQAAAKLRWSRKLSKKELDVIFYYSERHPYYLNLLCSRLLSIESPSPKNIEKIWMQYAIEERSHVSSELDLLTKNQKKLLIVLSRTGGAKAALGKEFIYKTNMSKTTVRQCLIFLERRDYIFRDENNLVNILDPLIKTVLSDV